MNKQMKNELVPELRFPKFRDAREWAEMPLKKVFSIFQGFAFSSKDSVRDGVRWLKIADVSIQRMNHSTPSYLPTEYKDKYEKFSVKQGDYVIALTRPILSKQLKMAQVDKVFHGALLNQRVGKLVTTQNIAFVYFLLQTSKVISDIEKSISGSEPPNLSAQQIEDIKTYIPSSSKEQQKIADCLSSLDELITAHSQKHEALKAHKKGLMQQLFPAEGETIPKLRFPEFRDAGEWGAYKIGDFIESHKGGASLTPKDFVPYSNYEVIPKKAIIEGAWLNLDTENSTHCTEGFYNKNLQAVVDSAYLITTLRDLVPSGPSIGYIVKYTGKKKYILAQGVYGLKLKKTFVSDFLIHFSNTTRYRKLVNAIMVGSTQVHIRNGDFLKLPFNVPAVEEQQKVADCLSSLDDLITAQTQKIESLKSHKKGLMQQLFPAADEVNG